MQLDEPDVAAKVPATQLEHEKVPSEKYPALHELQAVAPAAEKKPEAQAAQLDESAAPVVARKVPATQDVQSLDSALLAEYVPAAQLTQALALAAEYMPVVQLEQLNAEVAPVDARKVPAGQVIHADRPVTAA